MATYVCAHGALQALARLDHVPVCRLPGGCNRPAAPPPPAPRPLCLPARRKCLVELGLVSLAHAAGPVSSSHGVEADSSEGAVDVGPDAADVIIDRALRGELGASPSLAAV
jgi:hypothetical protein